MGELIEHLGINWKLLVAQIINFAVIFVVLKIFVFGPILAAIRKRRQEIERGLEVAKEGEKNLERIAHIEEEALLDARKKAIGIVNVAEEDAEARREGIMQDAARKSEAIVQDAKRAIREERARITEEITKDAATLVRLGIAKVLGKMPAHERDDALIEDALAELKTVVGKSE